MTQAQVLSDAKLRLSHLITTELLDDQTMLWMINWACREVNFRLLPYRREFYLVEGLAVTTPQQLPYAMVGSRLERCILSSIEARYVTPPEFFFMLGGIAGGAVTDNPATSSYPIYTIYGDNGGNTRLLDSYPATLTGTVDYYALPADLATDGSALATAISVPIGFEPAVILSVVVQALTKLNEQNKAQMLYKSYVEQFSNIEGQLPLQQLSRRIALQSLPFPAKQVDEAENPQGGNQ